jgi:SAM-dependent methyltransferase
MSRRPCPCCGDRDEPMHLIHRVELAPITGVTVINDYDVAQCTVCGMCFANGIPDQAAVSAYYAAASKYTSVSPSDAARHADTAHAIGETLRPASDAIILDVGSGAAGLTNALKPMRVVSADPAEGTVPELLADGTAFDGAVLSGVLEHVVDVRRLLRKIHNLLKPDGWLWVEVPNAALFHQYSTGTPLQEFSSEHVNFFTPASLRRTLANAGFAFAEFYVRTVWQTPTQESPTLVMWARALDFAQVRAPLLNYLDVGTAAVARYVAAAQALPSPCILWGAGTLTRRLWPHLEAKALYVTDSNTAYHGAMVNRTAIIPPVDATQYALATKTPIIALTQGSVDAIQDAAKALGVTATALLDYAP